jgi:hypothetical protein
VKQGLIVVIYLIGVFREPSHYRVEGSLNMNDLIMRDIDRMTGKTHAQCDDVKREAQIHIHTASD